ncbi:MAG: D-alanyl-D-alanine carboxypeptidase family protein [Rhodobacterales bacterium]
MTALRVVLWAFLVFVTTVSAQAFETPATAAYVLDVNTGTVLFEKNADRPLPPASMSKLMTLNLLFEALQSGRVTLDTEFVVSERAYKMGGSKMFLRQGERVTVRNLIPGVIVQSGNDACVVIAEGLEGSEDEFARKMTVRAKKLGLTNSRFANATGWPDPGQRMSARDLVLLAQHILATFPDYYPFFSQKSFTWAGITQNNRNPLLTLDVGADGMKTGHTQEAGYGLVGSAKQGDRRVILMLSGMQSKAQRASEGERVMTWAFRNFVEKTLYKKGNIIGSADVWLGKQDKVELYSPTAIIALVPYDAVEDLTAEIRYKGPISAPIAKDAKVATLVLERAGKPLREYPLYARAEVPKGGLFVRMKTSAKKLTEKLLGPSADR